MTLQLYKIVQKDKVIQVHEAYLTPRPDFLSVFLPPDVHSITISRLPR